MKTCCRHAGYCACAFSLMAIKLTAARGGDCRGLSALEMTLVPCCLPKVMCSFRGSRGSIVGHAGSTAPHCTGSSFSCLSVLLSTLPKDMPPGPWIAKLCKSQFPGNLTQDTLQCVSEFCQYTTIPYLPVSSWVPEGLLLETGGKREVVAGFQQADTLSPSCWLIFLLYMYLAQCQGACPPEAQPFTKDKLRKHRWVPDCRIPL